MSGFLNTHVFKCIRDERNVCTQGCSYPVSLVEGRYLFKGDNNTDCDLSEEGFDSYFGPGAVEVFEKAKEDVKVESNVRKFKCIEPYELLFTKDKVYEFVDNKHGSGYHLDCYRYLSNDQGVSDYVVPVFFASHFGDWDKDSIEEPEDIEM